VAATDFGPAEAEEAGEGEAGAGEDETEGFALPFATFCENVCLGG